MGAAIDITGNKYGKLTAIKYLYSNQTKKRIWQFICDCGNIIERHNGDVKTGGIKSCGCLKNRGIDPKRERPEYGVWRDMIQRCTNINNANFKYYGKKGITVCDPWRKSYKSFLLDMGERPSKKYSIDRIDVKGNYEPGNCRWATRYVQDRNRRNNRILTFKGESLPMIDWCKRLKVKSQTLRCYLKRHSFDQAYMHYAK
jgi:hypothetical protein